MKLNQTSLQNIENEIEKFESQVDFEFIPVIAQQSSYTEHVAWVLSLLFMLIFTLIAEPISHFLSDVIFHNSWGSYTAYSICVLIISVLLSNFLSRIDVVKRLFISQPERNRQTLEKARMVFFTKRLSDIKSQNALLVFISLMEHRIVILPDPNIKMKDINKLTSHCVEILSQNFKQQRFEAGIIEVIQYVQAQLQSEFPRKTQGENVVSNKLIWWQD